MYSPYKSWICIFEPFDSTDHIILFNSIQNAAMCHTFHGKPVADANWELHHQSKSFVNIAKSETFTLKGNSPCFWTAGTLHSFTTSWRVNGNYLQISRHLHAKHW